ncbi:MAG TPA: sulfotransferase [Solirubrobacteraceae bacterium]|jgi:hypothetical protein|nr:sulfotransferase [Solirubrobacteraceae bacterium]
MALSSAGGRGGPGKTKVLYVMGAGRSGSTILGVALGNCAEVCFAGELDKWLPRSGEPKRRDSERVAFWSSVRPRVADAEPLFGGQSHRYLERSSALFRRGRRRARRRLVVGYRRVASELYAAVAATAGASCVVDTSHYALRARELQSLPGVELYLLMLVRHPQDVVASFAKDDVVERRFSPPTTRAYLLLTYLVSSWVFLRQPRERRTLLRYEDLLEDPHGVLGDLLAWVGCASETPDFDALETGVAFHGNRMLGESVVALQRHPPASAQGDRIGRLFARLMLFGLERLGPRVKPRSTDAGSRSRAGVAAS